MINKKIIFFFAFLLAGIIITTLIILFKTQIGSAYHIDGNNVWWDNSYGKLVVWPHTSSQAITHTQYANLTSYIPANISLDFAFQFDEPVSNGHVWMWRNITHIVWIADYINITYLKDPGNQTCGYWGCNEQDSLCNCTTIQEIGGHEISNNYYDWKDVTQLFEHSEFNDSHFYWIRNITFSYYETKQAKWKYDQPLGTSGKWGLWIKKNSDTIQEALQSGQYIHLDPWWNSNWGQRVNITITETGGVARNNEIADVWVNLTTGNCTKEYRVLLDDSVELTSQVYNESYSANGKCTAANVLFMVNLTANEHKNVTIYFNNSGASAPNYDSLVKSDSQFITPSFPAGGQNYNLTLDFIDLNTQIFLNSSLKFRNTTNAADLPLYYGTYNGQTKFACVFNNTIKIKGPLMIETAPSAHGGWGIGAPSGCNSTLRIFPYYAEINVLNNGSALYISLVSMNAGGFLPNYTFFGNMTLYRTKEITGSNNHTIKEVGIANRTFNYFFSNSSGNGFMIAYQNLSSSFNMMYDTVGGICARIGVDSTNCQAWSQGTPDITNISFKFRVAVNNNFSDAGWQVARDERIKLEYPLTYTISPLQAPSTPSGQSYNITGENYETSIYETIQTNSNITIWINNSQIQFIDARLVQNSINIGKDSNSTSDNITKTYKAFTHDLLDANATSENFYWNLTIYWVNGSIGAEQSTTHAQTFNYAYVFTNVESDKTVIVEGDNIIANGTITKQQYVSIPYVKFNFQDANYTGAQILNLSTKDVWEKLIQSKMGAGGNAVLFGFFNVSFNGITKERISITNVTISLYQIFMDNCSNYSTIAYNFFHKDEETRNHLNGTFETTFTAWSDNKDYAANYSFFGELNTSWSLCIYPEWLNLTTDMHMIYKNESTHTTRAYYLVSAPLNNITRNVSLYSLLLTKATAFKITVLDNARIPKEGVYIKSQRYSPATNSYYTVEMGKTDNYGKTSMYFVLNSVDYKFIVEENGVVIYSTIPGRIICHVLPCEIEFLITDVIGPFGSIDPISGLTRSLIYNNQTEIVRLEWSDATGNMQYARLLVNKKRAMYDDVVCDVSDSSTAGALVCDLSGEDGTFFAEGKFASSPEESDIWITITKALATVKEIFGREGIWWLIPFILACALAGYWNPAVAIMSICLGFVLFAFLGFASIPYAVLISIIAVGIAYMINIKT